MIYLYLYIYREKGREGGGRLKKRVRREQLSWQYCSLESRSGWRRGVVQFLNTTLLAERYGISEKTATFLSHN